MSTGLTIKTFLARFKNEPEKIPVVVFLFVTHPRPPDIFDIGCVTR
jgi:hypothetical protein